MGQRLGPDLARVTRPQAGATAGADRVSFLLDTHFCSNHLKSPSRLIHRFIQHSGKLNLATIVLGELHARAYQRRDPAPLLRSIQNDLLPEVTVIPFDDACAHEFGRLRGLLLSRGAEPWNRGWEP
jgi:predicted nucleic acid-binding protein